MEGVIDVRNSPVGKQVTKTSAPSHNTTGTAWKSGVMRGSFLENILMESLDQS